MTLAQFANKFENKQFPPSFRFVSGLSNGETVDSISHVYREMRGSRRSGLVRVEQYNSTHVAAFDPSEQIEII